MLKRTFLFIFFMHNMPLHSMTTVTRRVAPQLTTRRLTLPSMTSGKQGFRSFQTKPVSLSKNRESITIQAASSWLNSWKDSFSRYWYGTSANVPAIKQSFSLYNTDVNPQELIKAMQSPESFHDNPILCDKVKTFLQNNTLSDIEGIFTALLNKDIKDTRSCLKSLQSAIKKDEIFAKKMILTTENFFKEFHNAKSASPLNIGNLAYILGSISNNIDPSKLELLKQNFWNAIFYTDWLYDWISEGNLLDQLLPNEIENFIKTLGIICAKTDARSRSNKLYEMIILTQFAHTIEQKKLTDTDIKHLFSELIKTDYGNKVASLCSISTAHLLSLCSGNQQTPSCLHLQKYKHSMPIGYYFSTTEDNFLNMLKNVIAKEKEAMNDNEVFYHGRWWEYGFLSDIFDILHSYKSDIEPGGFVFPHLNDSPTGKKSELFLAAEQEKREYLKRHGNRSSHLTKSTEKTPEAIEAYLNRQRLLFVNKFLFGNLERPGSNSIDYIIHNYNQNQGDIDFSVQEIFSMFGYTNVYKKHEKEILALQRKYNSLSKYGELLQIIVPKNMVDKCVYYTTSGGPKLTYTLSDGTKTTDIKKILQDEDQNPRDIGEYAIIMTHDIGLDPKRSGIQITSHNTVDPAIWANFKKELKDFTKNELKPSLQQADIQKQHSLTITE